MPYIPRSIAPVSGLGLDFNTVPKAPASSSGVPKPAVPLKSASSSFVAPRAAQKNPLTGKLSMRDWDVDPLRVMKQILGKEYKADEHSGLVSNS